MNKEEIEAELVRAEESLREWQRRMAEAAQQMERAIGYIEALRKILKPKPEIASEEI